MGNKQSQANAADKSATYVGDSDDAESGTSGVFLAADLEEEMRQDFQSKVLQFQWQDFQRSFLTDRAQRRVNEQELERKLKEEIDQWKEQNEQIQEQCDESIHDVKSRFAEYENGLRYNVENLKEKIESVPKFGYTSNACLQIRSDLAKCFLETPNPTDCDDLTVLLEKCAQKTVMK